MQTADSRRHSPWTSTFLLAGWLACSVYVWSTLDHGWIPHDEGTLAHAAERVLAGQLPHRDFADVYTGGQAMLHAVALNLRDDLMGPRIVLFCFFVLWIPAVYWIARRFAGVRVAAAGTLLSVALGLPLYPAAMPSWYNLYFATFGLAALLAWFESSNPRWLLVAGLLAGLSILFKISGLYFMAAALLTIAIHEVGRPAERGSEIVFPTLLTLGAIALAAAVCALVVPRGGVGDVLYFVVPVLLVCLVVVAMVWTDRTNLAARSRLASIGRSLLPFAVGAAVPIALFLIPYVHSRSVGELLNGLFVLPAMRFEHASMEPPPLVSWLFVPPLGATFLIAELSPGIRTRPGLAVLICVLGTFLWASESQWGYLASWIPLYHLPTVVVVVGSSVIAYRTVRLWKSGLRRQSEPDHRVLVLIAAVAVCSLVQFPFAAAIYAAYVAPLAILALIALLSTISEVPGRGALAVFPYLAVFLFIRAHPGTIRELGVRAGERVYTERLDLERGGILVTPAEKDQYERAVHLLKEHATGGYILSTPDSPEIYYLARLSNPTDRLFDFFSEDASEDLLTILRARNVTAVAINEQPDFSPPLSPRTLEAIARLLPRSERAGKFTLRWAP